MGLSPKVLIVVTLGKMKSCAWHLSFVSNNSEEHVVVLGSKHESVLVPRVLACLEVLFLLAILLVCFTSSGTLELSYSLLSTYSWGPCLSHRDPKG